MDLATHALSSLALARGFLPRRTWPLSVGMVTAGTLADIDLFAAFRGPAAYLAVRRTLFHSVPAAVFITALSAILAIFLQRWNKAAAGEQFVRVAPQSHYSLGGIVLAVCSAAIVHLLLDFVGSDGIELLWPVDSRRFAADCLPGIDAWILLLLGAAILLPEIFRLVSAEIGAKTRKPHGRTAALLALSLIACYLCARGIFHAEALGFLEPRAYRGESPRRIAAFADQLSPFLWHGVVETETDLCLVSVPVLGVSRFDPEAANCVHKPEPSSALAAAQGAYSAQQFLRVARFPKASVSRSEGGFEVVIHDLRDAAEGVNRLRVAAQIELDRNAQIIHQQLIWAADRRLR